MTTVLIGMLKNIGSQFILKPASRPEGKIIFAPFDVLFFVLSEKFAPQEVPPRIPWGCERPQLRTAALEYKLAVAFPILPIAFLF